MKRPDNELVSAARNGDHTAFAILYDRYAPLVRAICFDIVGNLNDAQDLAQEVFLRVYKNIAVLENPDRFDAWLVGITRRTGKEWLRNKAKARRHLQNLSDDYCLTDRTIPRNFETLYAALNNLPEDERLAIHLFYLEEQSIKQASGLFGYSRSGFYRLLERARKRLGGLLRTYQETER